MILKIKKIDKKWWLLYCRGWKKNKECEERVLLIVVVVIDCGVSTTVNTTILLIYILIYIIFIFCLLKSLKIPGDDDVSPIGLKPISQSVR